MTFIRAVRVYLPALVYVPWILGILVCLLLFNGALNNAGNSLNHLASTCNLRLLDSVRTWTELGFWQLGGLMSFRDSLTPLPLCHYSAFCRLSVRRHSCFLADDSSIGLRGCIWDVCRSCGIGMVNS